MTDIDTSLPKEDALAYRNIRFCEDSEKDDFTSTLIDSQFIKSSSDFIDQHCFQDLSLDSSGSNYITAASTLSNYDVIYSDPTLSPRGSLNSLSSTCSSTISGYSSNDITTPSTPCIQSLDDKFQFDFPLCPLSTSNLFNLLNKNFDINLAGQNFPSQSIICKINREGLRDKHKIDDEDYKDSIPIASLFDYKNKDEYFWKYNIQSKGPKTIKSYVIKCGNPYTTRTFEDPVCRLQLTTTNRSIYTINSNHTLPKLRKGDGNDATPNPLKLLELGKCIKHLSKKSLTLQYKEKQTQKREKNKLASRSCRLKKKAQHEAYKLKLEGLNQEHRVLLECIDKIKLIIKEYVSSSSQRSYSLTEMYSRIASQYYDKTTKVAGDTDNYVSRILQSFAESCY